MTLLLPAFSAPQLPCRHSPSYKTFHPKKCPSRTTTMVMERSLSPNDRRSPGPSNENLDDMHDRLGLDKLWDHPEVHHQSVALVTRQQSLQPPLAEANCDDITVIGDEAPVATVAMPWDTTTGAQGISLLGRRMQFLKKRGRVLAKSYAECERITELYSKTFYMGTRLLNDEKRRAVWAVYTWCRRTDDLVDGPRVTQRSGQLLGTLAEWEQRLEDIFKGNGRDALDLAMADVVAKFPDLNISPFRDMIRGMVMDVQQDRFDTFDDLYLYCYRVAGTVGLMTLPIMGTVAPGQKGLMDATKPALALGIALQLTNILRDVGEDRLRGRIYLPLEDLRRFNYTEEDLFNCVLDTRYKNLMKFEIARARRYYRQARKGVALLAEDSRLPVQASLDMYSQILDVLEANGYDNFNRRAYLSKSKKMMTVPLSYLRTRTSDAWSPFLSATEFLMAAGNDPTR